MRDTNRLLAAFQASGDTVYRDEQNRVLARLFAGLPSVHRMHPAELERLTQRVACLIQALSNTAYLLPAAVRAIASNDETVAFREVLDIVERELEWVPNEEPTT